MRPSRSFLLCAVAIAALGAVGCASDGTALESDDSDPQALQAPGGEQTLKDPNDAYFASVTANGTGCPKDTWSTMISDDGHTFTTSFSAFETKVNRSNMVSVKDCQLNITLHSPQGLQFAVQEFYYGGYAYLEEGVSLRQISNYYFSGSPDRNSEARSELMGPFDDTVLVQDTRKEGQLVWQPCGQERNLQVRSTLRLLNSSPRREGYANIAAIDAETKLIIKFAWKKCDSDE